MRSRTLLAVALTAALAGCAKPEGAPACHPVGGWIAPTFRCAAPAAPVVEPKPEPEPEPEPVEPEPKPEPEPPKAEVKSDKIELSETVQFETDSAVLIERSKALLDDVAKAMADHPEVTKVQIEGHTDSQASRRHNQKLSLQRVASVKAYLLGKGVEASRLTTKGFGADKPIASNKTEAGRAKNRRVEFRITHRKKP
jgi:OOP family OmpA-OmpF porin